MNNKKTYSVCHLLYEEFPRDPRVRRYVNMLNEQNIFCIIICSKKKNDSYFEEWNGNLIYRIPVSKKRGSFFITLLEYLLFTNFSCYLLICLGIKYRFKIIHVHTLPDFLIFAAIWNKIFGAKTILDLHEIFPELYMARTGAPAESFKVKLLKFAEKLSIKLANMVITIHEPAKEIFISRNKGIENKIDVVMNTIDSVEFKPASNENSNEFTIIYNGTIVKLLNLGMIIEAVAGLKDKMPAEDYNKIIFKLYGDGPVINDLLSLASQKGIKDKVKYLGFLPSDKMRVEALKASVLILPPLKNIYSDLFYTIKLIETIGMGIPVIATRLNTYKSYYREESLFYFDSGNLEQLEEKIMEVFYNKELVRQKTLNAAEDYNKIGRPVMKDRYLKIINSLL